MKTLLLFTTMALALLLAAGMAGAALPAPTVVGYGVGTATVPPTTPPTGVDPNANITATFSEAMVEELPDLQPLHHHFLVNTFYLLPGGHFTAPRPNKNPPYHCTTIGTRCPDPIRATVSYNVGNKTAFYRNPNSTLQRNTPYTAVVEGTAYRRGLRGRQGCGRHPDGHRLHLPLHHRPVNQRW